MNQKTFYFNLRMPSLTTIILHFGMRVRLTESDIFLKKKRGSIVWIHFFANTWSVNKGHSQIFLRIQLTEPK